MDEDANDVGQPGSPNPFSSPLPYELEPADPTKPETKPRLWTAFAVFFAAFFLMIFLSVIAVLLYVAPTIIRQGGQTDPNSLIEQLSTPLGVIIQSLPAQLAMAITVSVAAYLSPVQWKERIGFRDSGLTTTEWLAAGIGSFVPAAIGLGFAYLMSLVVAPDESVQLLYESMTITWAVPFILFIALAPGFAEEMLMRGYMQRRFLQRWSPALSIFVSATLFALLHIMPHPVVFAFPIGLWFGYVAWKTDSIWPTILGHALINGCWNILNISTQLMGLSDATYYVLCGILFVVGLAGFVYSWPAIHRVAAQRTRSK